MEVQDKKKKISLELVRFVITGIICALADFLVSFLVKEMLSSLSVEWLKIVLYTLAGFIVGVILNYFLSTYWVFQNVADKKKTKTPMFVLLYVVLSAIGWLLSYLTMQLCTIAFVAWFEINISESLIGDGISWSLFVSASLWLFFIAFVLKTIIGMIWNYLTRKLILYKAPKKEDEEITNG